MQYEDTPTREFKGIWIPAEIWEDETLTVNEKILYLEIDSFTSNDKSCFISNEHIAKLLHVSENAASKILNSLVKKRLIIVTKFDGRKRYIQSVARQTRQKAKADERKEQLSIGEKDTYYNQDTNTNNNKKEKPSKKKDDFDFFSAITSIGVDEIVANDWMRIRESKKASNSETAFKQLSTALETIKRVHDISFNDAISVCVTNGWYGCKPSYFDNIKLEDYGIGTQTSLYTKNNGKGWQ